MLAVLLLLPVLTACGSAGENAPSAGTTAPSANAEETAAETTEFDYLATLPDEDFDGTVYTIAAQSTEQRPNLPADEETGEVLNDALILRNRMVSERCNVTIENVIYPNKPDPVNNLKKAVTAGDYLCDLVICYMASGGMSTTAQGGYLYDLAAVDMLSLSENWWCPSFFEDVNVNGHLYFTTGPLSPSYYYTPLLTVYNVNLADSYGLTGMQDKVLDGSYTMDYFKSLTAGITADLNGDGKMTGEDLYAVTHNDYGNAFMFGFGMSTMKRDADGTLEMDLENAALIDMIEKTSAFLADTSVCFPSTDTDMTLQMFQADRAVFYVSAANNIITGYTNTPSCREMESDYSFLPMPKYTESQDAYMTCASPHMPTGIGIAANCPDVYRAGLITELLAYFSLETVREAAYEKVVKQKLTREAKSEEVLDIIFAGIRFDNNIFMDFGGSGTLATDAACGVKTDYISKVAALKDKAEKALADYIAMFAD